MMKSSYDICSLGDIVQITDDTHPWFPALLIVSEVKNWGVQAYTHIPERGDAYTRIPNESFVKVGKAVIVDDNEE